MINEKKKLGKSLPGVLHDLVENKSGKINRTKSFRHHVPVVKKTYFKTIKKRVQAQIKLIKILYRPKLLKFEFFQKF